MTAKEAKAPTKKTKTTKSKAAGSKAKAAATSKPKAQASKLKVTEQPKAKAGKGEKDGLRAWNLRLGLVLVAEAIAVVVASGKRTAELTTQYLAKDVLATDAASQDIYTAATRHVADARLSWVVAGFLLAFAASFLLAATVWAKKYASWMERGVNKLRWAGLGVGGGAAVAVVAMLSGVTDAAALTLAFGSVVLAGVLAASVELIGAGRRLRKLLGLGAILAVLMPWLVFAYNVYGVVKYGGNMPVYLYFVYVTVTLLVLAVGLGLYFRVKRRGKWMEARYTEKMFMGLSFAAATLLAVQIFAGALQP